MYVENDKHESYGNSAIINLEEIDSDAIYIQNVITVLISKEIRGNSILDFNVKYNMSDVEGKTNK